jgi:hypothetical protein
MATGTITANGTRSATRRARPRLGNGVPTKDRDTQGPCTMVCNACKHELRTDAWALIEECPHCSSKAICVKPEFASLLAASPESDRHRAHADALAALLAVWGGHAGPWAVTKCLRLQCRDVLAGKATRLTALLEAKGCVNNMQAAVLSRYVSETGEARDEASFIKLAVQGGELHRPQADALTALRAGGRQAGRKAGPVILTALEENLLREDQLAMILTCEKQRNRGILHRLKELEAMGKPKQRTSPARNRMLLALAGVAAAVSALMTTLLFVL